MCVVRRSFLFALFYGSAPLTISAQMQVGPPRPQSRPVAVIPVRLLVKISAGNK